MKTPFRRALPTERRPASPPCGPDTTGLSRRYVCIPGQRQPPRVATLTIMKAEDMKIAVVIAWTLIWSVIAVSLASSASSWFLLVGSGVLPPIMILWMWHPPARTVSAAVREVRK